MEGRQDASQESVRHKDCGSARIADDVTDNSPPECGLCYFCRFKDRWGRHIFQKKPQNPVAMPEDMSCRVPLSGPINCKQHNLGNILGRRYRKWYISWYTASHLAVKADAEKL